MKACISSLFGIPSSHVRYLKCKNGVWWHGSVISSQARPLLWFLHVLNRHDLKTGLLFLLLITPRTCCTLFPTFGGFWQFLESCAQKHPSPWPKLSFTDFFPDHILPVILTLHSLNRSRIMSKSSESSFFSSRVGSRKGRKIQGLDIKSYSFQTFLTPLLRKPRHLYSTLHHGNFFKSTAVLASLGGKDHIQSFLTTSPPPQLWTTRSWRCHQAFDRLHQ